MEKTKCLSLYFVWAIMINQDKSVNAGEEFKSPVLSKLERIDREVTLMKMTLAVNNSKTLSMLIDKDEESAILKIFSNVFNAYYEWLDEDISDINLSELVYTVLDNFEILDNACCLARNYSKDYLLKCFNLVNNKDARTVHSNQFEKTILNTLKAVEKVASEKIKI